MLTNYSCQYPGLATLGQADLPAFLAAYRVEIVASLPHYRALNTDRQRGDGVDEKSIAALKTLNAAGYGDGRSGLRLVLATNPVGAFLPPSESSIEAEWKREVLRLYGVTFDALYCITNMPISRYFEWLIDSGNLAGYMERLVAAFNPGTVNGVMCRDTLSIGGTAGSTTAISTRCSTSRCWTGAPAHPRLRCGRSRSPAGRRGPALLRMHRGRRIELRRQYKIGACRRRSACSAGSTRWIPRGGRSAANDVSFRTWRAGPTARTRSPQNRSPTLMVLKDRSLKFEV